MVRFEQKPSYLPDIVCSRFEAKLLKVPYCHIANHLLITVHPTSSVISHFDARKYCPFPATLVATCVLAPNSQLLQRHMVPVGVKHVVHSTAPLSMNGDNIVLIPGINRQDKVSLYFNVAQT